MSIPGVVEFFDGTGNTGQVVSLIVKPLTPLVQVSVKQKDNDGRDTWVELQESVTGYEVDIETKNVTLHSAALSGKGTIRVSYLYDPSSVTFSISFGGLASFAPRQVEVSSISPTRLDTGPLSSRKSILVKANVGNTGAVYVGNSNVTTGTGFELVKQEFIELPVDSNTPVYAIGGGPGQYVSVMEVA
jgi:hypothetical protein